MILVTAAYGHQGQLLIPKLAAAGYRIRAARASAGKDEELKRLGATEVFVGDLSDPEVYARAAEGIDAIYHVGPAAVREEKAMGLAMIEAAKKAGVRHVVYSAVLHPIIDIIQHRYKRDVEEKLAQSRLKYTVLKPCDYMMPEVYIQPVFETGVFTVFWNIERGRGSLVDINDLTDVGLKVLCEGEKHYYASYELVGPDKLTAYEVARILSRVMGKDVKAQEKTPEDLFKLLYGTDSPGDHLHHEISIMRSICKWYSANEFVGNPNVLTWLLGRPPTSFEQFATKAFAGWKNKR
ncbi:MAG: NmrA family NAD(P)-binding protein [Caulobacterales bacterium]